MSESLSRTPSLGQLLANAMTARLADVHTALPAKVERYDAAKQCIDAQPLLKSSALTEDGTLEVESLPIIRDVPVVFPGGGGFRVTFPVAVGDTVLLVFSEASLDKWLQQGGHVDPADTRRHHLADAVAIPGLRPFNAALSGASESSLTLGKDGGIQIEITGSDIKLNGGGTPVAKEGSATVPHLHAGGTAGPFPVVLPPEQPAIASGAGSPTVKVP